MIIVILWHFTWILCCFSHCLWKHFDNSCIYKTVLVHFHPMEKNKQLSARFVRLVHHARKVILTRIKWMSVNDNTNFIFRWSILSVLLCKYSSVCITVVFSMTVWVLEFNLTLFPLSCLYAELFFFSFGLNLSVDIVLLLYYW